MLIAVKNHLKICVCKVLVSPVPNERVKCAMRKQFSNLSKSTFLCSCKYWLEQIWSDVSLSPHNFSAMDIKNGEFCKYFAVANNHSLSLWEEWESNEKEERSTRQIFALTGFMLSFDSKKNPTFHSHSTVSILSETGLEACWKSQSVAVVISIELYTHQRYWIFINRSIEINYWRDKKRKIIIIYEMKVWYENMKLFGNGWKTEAGWYKL